MSANISKFPFPTTRPIPNKLHLERFNHVFVSTLKSKPTKTKEHSSLPWPNPPSPISFDLPHKKQTHRIDSLLRYVNKKGKIQIDTNIWPTLSPITFNPPPNTKMEKEYHTLCSQCEHAETRLKIMYADIHLRMYILGILRPSDYSHLGDGTLKSALDNWLKTIQNV